jgi:hypothetical protein
MGLAVRRSRKIGFGHIVTMPIVLGMGQSSSAGGFNLSRRNNIAAIQRADSTDEMQRSHLFPGSSGAPLPEQFLSRLN